MKIYDVRRKPKSVFPSIVSRPTTTPGPPDPTEH